MKKLIFFLIISIVFVSLQSKEIILDKNAKLFNCSYSNLQTTHVKFTLDKYNTEEITQKDVVYQKLSYPGEGEVYEFGKPDLPAFTRFVAIPDKGNVEINLNSSDFIVIHNINVYPRQKDTPTDQFLIDEDFYQKNTQFPEQTAKIYEPVIQRDYRMVPLRINPFQYNPKTKTLRIYKTVDVTINSTGGRGINEKDSNRKHSRAFQNIYASTIINFNQIRPRDDDFQSPSLLIIYDDNSDLAQRVNIIANWKHQKGFDVYTASTIEAGNTEDAIKAFIQEAYDYWDNPPEYIMLVGDAYSEDYYYIPTGHMGGGAGDQTYVRLDGNDLLADAIIGRLSVDSLEKMQVVVNKILYYEKNPYMGSTDWYNKAILVGDPSSSGQSTISTNKYIKELIAFSNPNFQFEEQYSGNFSGFMTTALNNGALYFNYRGYIGMSGFENSDISNLNNGFKLPYVVDITCATGNFDSSGEESRSETFLTAGTPTNPAGGIAAIGTATSTTHTCFNNIVATGTYYGIFRDSITTAGGALNRGKLALYLNYPQNPSNHTAQFSYWNNLMGDPSVELWTGTPQELNIDFNDIVSIGTNYEAVHCYDQTGNPIKDVWVTAVTDDDAIFSTGFTDESGNYILDIANAPVGSIHLTATKHNYIPAINTITVTNDDQNLAIISYDIDDSSGNNDHLPNPGETFNMTLNVKNLGNTTENNVTATIISHTDNINVLTSTVNFPSIEPNQTESSTDSFSLGLNPQILDGDSANLEIEITSGAYTHTEYLVLNVHAPLLLFDSYQITNNPDGILDPGESASLFVVMNNIGQYGITNLYATLSTESGLITITDDEGYFGSLPIGQSSNNFSNKFSLEASSNLVPGMVLQLMIHFHGDNGFEQDVPFGLTVGNPSITDPLGPDSYGYFIYDDGDIGYANVPVYDWIELNPDEGGDGTSISLNDTGDDESKIATIDLPMSFKYYGTLYNTLTVCSDGWVAPGTHEQTSFMNWHLPGPYAPASIIAPFWDDLKMNSGTSKVLYKYFADENIFVVEWSHMLNDYDTNYEETFETIFYDYAQYPSPTGDSNIKFQYKTVNNVDAGVYGEYHVHHGQYATVGIQDETGTIGLEYTFNNTYPTTEKPLEDNMALFITGRPISYQNAFLTVESPIIQDDDNHNGQIDFGEHIRLYIKLNNIGQQTATDVSATISTSDEYVTLGNTYSRYPGIAPDTDALNLYAFTFDVSPDVPNNHSILLHMDITSSTSQWSYLITLNAFAPDIEYQNYYVVNDTDGDGLLSQGETANVVVISNNVGGAPLTNLHCILSSTDPYMTIENGSFDISHIYGNRVFGSVFQVTIAQNTPDIYSFPMNMSIQSEAGYVNSLDFPIFVGSAIEDFESGDFSLFDWEFPNQQWLISNEHHSGLYSAQSNDINDNESTTMQVQLNVGAAASIKFWRKVSSEHNYDYLRFYIDNNEQESWSGEVPWGQAMYPVSAGQHTFSWAYTKDGSVSHGSDCAWVDYIEFPGATAGGTADPELTFNYDSFVHIINPGDTVIDTLDITNIGSGNVLYSLSIQNVGPEFVTIDSTEGSVYTGVTNHIQLTIDTQGLQEGEYEANLIVDDDRNHTVIPVQITVQTVGAHDNQIPSVNMLYANYPNPFILSQPSKAGGTTIKFAIKKSSDVKLKIYNLKGQLVKILLQSHLRAGTYYPVWNGKDMNGKSVASGLYLYRLETNEYHKIKKMIVIK